MCKGAGAKGKRARKGRGKHLERDVEITKKDYKATVTEWQQRAGHLHCRKPADFDAKAENDKVTLTEVYTFELGRYGGIYNTFFAKVSRHRKSNDDHGWYSAMAAFINEERKAIQDARNTSLARLEIPMESTAMLDESTEILADLPFDFFDDNEVGATFAA